MSGQSRSGKSAIGYHLEELQVARDPSSPAWSMPEFLPTDQAILDIGCGIGQTLLAAGLEDRALLVGVDTDRECLTYGTRRCAHIRFVHASAERLPFAPGSFDLVISRVSLPYTDLPVALREIHRVLKPGGRVWFTLHPASLPLRRLLQAAARFELKDVVFRTYVLANGLLLHVTGRQITFPNGRQEAFQTRGAVRRALRAAGFSSFTIDKDHQFTVTARA